MDDSDSKVFLENYQALIDQSNCNVVPDFNPFAKMPPKSSNKIRLFAKMTLPYAAIFLLFLSVYWFLPRNKNSSVEIQLSKRELAEVNQNTIHALSLLSSELNNSMKEIQKTKELGEPFKRMIRSKIN